MTEITLKLSCPRAPNYILIEQVCAVPRHCGPIEDFKIPVSALTEKQKDELAAEWRAALDEVAQRQREAKS